MIWRGASFEGRTININQDGLRNTPGADCGTSAYKVFTFGGSTMWGSGSPDWGTIPANLQANLEELKGKPFCVVNFGQDAFVATQNVIDLLTQLQSGEVPNVAIFYNGLNEVYAAYQSGEAGVHHNLDRIANRFNKHPLIIWLGTLRQVSLLTGLFLNRDMMTYRTMGINAASLAESVAQSCFENYRIVSGVAREYGFDYFFFWQPAIAVSKKSLTTEEQQFRSKLDPALMDLYQEVYGRIERAAPMAKNLYYIADVLDGQDSQLWIDDASHVTPVGNQLIAKAMLDVIKDRLMNDRPVLINRSTSPIKPLAVQ